MLNSGLESPTLKDIGILYKSITAQILRSGEEGKLMEEDIIGG